MSTAFVRPIAFVDAGSQTPAAGAVSNLGIDLPGLVWRGTLPTPFLIVDLGASAVSYDCVALIATNLRTTDTIRIRTGTTNTGIGALDTGTVAAWVGYKDDEATANSIVQLPGVRTERYVRIDFVSTGNSDGYVKASRLCIGAKILTLGIDTDSQKQLDDRSIITAGPGYRSVDEYDTITGWKISTGWISEDDWRGKFFPFLRWGGNRRAFLFIVDTDATTSIQTDSCFGCWETKAYGSWEAVNAWRFEGTVMALQA